MLVLVSTSTVLADGFSSRIAAGLLVFNQADNLSGRGAATLKSLDEKPRSFTHLLPVPQIELRYSWEANSVYFGSPVEDPTGMNLGYRRTLANGAISGSVFYSFFGREWQNPYLVGIPREETRVNSYGGRIAFEAIGGSPLNLSVRGTVKNVVDEGLSGDLRRDGGKLDIELNWRQRLGGEWTLVPLAAYQRGEYQGAANSFHGGSLGLGADWHSGDVRVITRLSGNLNSYDQVHPVFNATRRDLGYRLSTMALLDNPFRWRNTFASAGIFHQWTDSNIDFFATRTTVGMAVIGYRF
jgi:hypothetical protein